jgi:flavorubredoxin
MMKARRIVKDVHWLGAVDWDRRLFDSLIPLPDGTSYNAYLVQGSQKTALLDTVDPAMAEMLLEQLDQVDRIDYLVSHHAEQDHSGSLPLVLERFPQAQVVCTPKAKGLLMDLLELDENRFLTVEDGETLSLGGKTLQCVHTPWVHWPETMVSYLQEDKILFSCDFFGSHVASSRLFVADRCRIYEAAKRYFAEIMMPFRRQIAKNLDRLKGLDIRMIAPSHGQIYLEPDFILEAYQDWVHSSPKNMVVLPYVSMHGSTTIMVDRLVAALVERGVQVEQFDLAVTDIGKLAINLVDAGSIVLGTPTIHAGPHPYAAYCAMLANALRPKAQVLSIIGSYGWGGKTVDTLAGLVSNLKVEVLDPVLCKGRPDDQTLQALDRLADSIAEKHKELGLV